MALTTYAELLTTVANYLARDDLAAYIPDAVVLFECAAARRLKIRGQETTTTLTPVSGVATLPGNYLGYRRVTWTGSPNQSLEYVAPHLWAAEWVPDSNGTAITGIPQIFTIEGTYLRVKPSSDTALTFDYFASPDLLVDGVNWLYLYYPDAYLFGTLCEMNAFNKGGAFEAASLWKQRRDEVLQEIQTVEFNERGGMAVRVMGYTP